MMEDRGKEWEYRDAKPHGPGHEVKLKARPLPKGPRAFSMARCPHPERVLTDVAGGITFRLCVPGPEYYGMKDGRLFRVAEEGEEPHAIYPKATEAHPTGVPLRALMLQELTDTEYQQMVHELPAPAPRGLPRRGPDWEPGG